MVERQLPKLHTGVRFPSPAPAFAFVTARAEAGASAVGLAKMDPTYKGYGWQASYVAQLSMALTSGAAARKFFTTSPSLRSDWLRDGSWLRSMLFRWRTESRIDGE